MDEPPQSGEASRVLGKSTLHPVTHKPRPTGQPTGVRTAGPTPREPTPENQSLSFQESISFLENRTAERTKFKSRVSHTHRNFCSPRERKLIATASQTPQISKAGPRDQGTIPFQLPHFIEEEMAHRKSQRLAQRCAHSGQEVG